MYLAQAAAALAVLAAPAHQHHPPAVTVRPGDTLAALARQWCGAAGDYPGLAAASGIANPDAITPGEHVTIACTARGPRSRWDRHGATVTAAATRPGRSYTGRHRDRFDGGRGECGDGDHDGMDADCAVIFPRHQASSNGSSNGGTSYAGRHRTYAAAATYQAAAGGFEACVIRRESDGNAAAVNPASGAGGLYQFLPSTWRALGFAGRPQDAPVSVQRAAFQKAYAESGVSPWRAYDGC